MPWPRYATDLFSPKTGICVPTTILGQGAPSRHSQNEKRPKDYQEKIVMRHLCRSARVFFPIERTLDPKLLGRQILCFFFAKRVFFLFCFFLYTTWATAFVVVFVICHRIEFFSVLLKAIFWDGVWSFSSIIPRFSPPNRSPSHELLRTALRKPRKAICWRSVANHPIGVSFPNTNTARKSE